MTIPYNLNKIEEVARTIILKLKKGVIVLEGDMGAGKTTLTRHLLKNLGVTDTVSSPTFSIINEYNLHDEKVYHFDFYRIQYESEAYEIGAEEIINSGAFCFIEWPQKIPSLLPSDFQSIQLDYNSEIERTLTFKG